MRNIVITGTSGVGKSFLEEELEKRGMSFQLPKYTDRERRPGENPQKLISLTKEEFKKNRRNFFFTLEYGGFNYGWKRKDLKKEPVSLAITQDSLEDFMKKNSNFLPIWLKIEENNLKLLKKRMEKRGDNKEKIEQRLKMSREEIKRNNKYEAIIKKYQGIIFEIKNDKTIFEEVIPVLAKKR